MSEKTLSHHQVDFLKRQLHRARQEQLHWVTIEVNCLEVLMWHWEKFHKRKHPFPTGGQVTISKAEQEGGETMNPNTLVVGQIGVASIPSPTPTGSAFAANQLFSWSSDNEAVATVDTSGNVTAVAAGSANIGASWTNPDGSTGTATPAALTVVPKPVYPTGGQVVVTPPASS
jgi:hypothetical protein